MAEHLPDKEISGYRGYVAGLPYLDGSPLSQQPDLWPETLSRELSV